MQRRANGTIFAVVNITNLHDMDAFLRRRRRHIGECHPTAAVHSQAYIVADRYITVHPAQVADDIDDA